MKTIQLKYILFLAGACLGINRVNAQVSVGSPIPNNSAQLDVVATNKGTLLTRVALTGTTDAATIISGNVTSLLVYNTATAGVAPNNVTPGYYYWNGTKWARMVNSDDVISLITSNQTVTNLVDNGNGTITYTNENGTAQTINIAAMVTANEIDGVIGNEVTNATTNGGLTRSGAGTTASPYTLGVTPGTASNQVLTWNGTAWVAQAPALSAEADGIIGNEVNNATSNGGLVLSGAGTTASPYTLGMTPGTVVGQSMVWNGTSWTPGAATEVDGIIGNEVNNATSNGGLVLSGAGTTASPYTLGMTPGTVVGQSMVWNGTSWTPGAATEVDGIIGNEVNNATANGGLTLSGAGTTVSPYTLGLTPGTTTNDVLTWNGTQWVSQASSSDWKLTGNAGTTAGTNFIGTTDNVDFVTKTNGSERMRVTSGGLVGVGTATPDASAKLDITSTKEGVLIPRLALTAKNVAAPVASPATSLLVYNTATAGVSPNNVTPGYYYWDGAKWARFVSDGVSLVTKRVSCAGTLSQTILDPDIPATDPILVTYEDPAGNVISTKVTSRVANTSFVVDFAAVPPATAFINYAYPKEGIVVATGPQGPAGSNALADGDAWAVTGEDVTSAIGRTGNVGIGTTTPAYKLQVEGSTSIGSSTSNANLFLNGTSPYMSFTNVSNMGANSDIASIFANTGISGGNATGANAGYILFLSSENHTTTAKGTNLVFGTTPNGTTSPLSRMYILNDGNVGIGTSLPATKLHVNSGAPATTAITTLSNSAGSVKDFVGSGTPQSVITGSVGDMYRDITNGILYLKRTGTNTNTGWSPLNMQVAFTINHVGGLTQAVPSASIVVMNTFPSVNYQVGGTNYNTATGLFTAPISGVYSFSGSLHYTKNAFSDNFFAIIVKNGSQHVSYGSRSAILESSVLPMSSVSAVVHLNAGETVSLNGYCHTTNASVTQITEGEFSGTLVSAD